MFEMYDFLLIRNEDKQRLVEIHTSLHRFHQVLLVN
jgi:hypothetical protein